MQIETRSDLSVVWFRLVGRGPLWMHKTNRFYAQAFESREETADQFAYRMSDGQLGMPPESLWGAMRDACVGWKIKQFPLKRLLMVTACPLALGQEDLWPLYHPKTDEPLYKFTTHRCGVQPPGGDTVLYLPVVPEWALIGAIEYERDKISAAELKTILKRACDVGIGHPRRGSKGNGLFKISWFEKDQAKAARRTERYSV